MDNKEKVKVVVEELENLIFCYKEGHKVDLQLRANLIIDVLKPSKVKLPKAAYEWMEVQSHSSKMDFSDLINNLDRLVQENQFSEDFKRFYIDDTDSLFKLVDAYRYGYELEETEEERIKRTIRETLHQSAGVMVSDEVVDNLYKIAKGDKQ